MATEKRKPWFWENWLHFRVLFEYSGYKMVKIWPKFWQDWHWRCIRPAGGSLGLHWNAHSCLHSQKPYAVLDHIDGLRGEHIFDCTRQWRHLQLGLHCSRVSMPCVNKILDGTFWCSASGAFLWQIFEQSNNTTYKTGHPVCETPSSFF